MSEQSKSGKGLQAFLLSAVAGLALWLLYTQATGRSASGPETILVKTVTLDEGESYNFQFEVDRPRLLTVSGSASPKPISVYLVDEAGFDDYSKGNSFQYFKAISVTKVDSYKRSEQIPTGRFRLLIVRPRESVLFTDKTTATVTLVAE